MSAQGRNEPHEDPDERIREIARSVAAETASAEAAVQVQEALRRERALLSHDLDTRAAAARAELEQADDYVRRAAALTDRAGELQRRLGAAAAAEESAAQRIAEAERRLVDLIQGGASRPRTLNGDTVSAMTSGETSDAEPSKAEAEARRAWRPARITRA